MRSFAWRSELTLFADAARKQDSAFSHSYLALALDSRAQQVPQTARVPLLQAAEEEHRAALNCADYPRVVFPLLRPALLTGFAMAFARALGEYGSVIFISGNMPMRTEITPLLIVTRLEQYDYAGATAIALVMLVASFALLLTINLLQWRSRRYAEAA